MRPSALLLCAESPYPTTGGGAMRSASVLEFLAQRYELDVTLFQEPGSPDPRSAFPNGFRGRISIIELPHHSRTKIARGWRIASRLLRERAPLIDRFSGFGSQVEATLQGRQYDVAIVEHLWCAPYVEQIRPHARTVLLDAHNIESVWHERIGLTGGRLQRAVFGRFASACRRFESKWMPRYDAVIVASEEDAGHVAGARTLVYPNCI